MLEKGYIKIQGKKILVFWQIATVKNTWHSCLKIRHEGADGTFLKDESNILQNDTNLLSRLKIGKIIKV